MEQPKFKKVRLYTILYTLLAFVVLGLVLIGILIYGFGLKNSLTLSITKVIPYPAAIIGGSSIITINSLEKNLLSVKQFYENQDFSQIGLRVDFSTSDGKKRLAIKEKNLLNKMVENRLLEIIANEKGIKISKEMVSQEVSRKMQEYDNQVEIKTTLERLYGWNINDFEEKIVKPDLYQEKIIDYLRNNDLESLEAKKKIEKALGEIKERQDFNEVVKKYSDGESVKDEGDLGWFSFDQMLPEIAIAAYSLKPNQTSEIIESPLGYHIIEVTDKKTEDDIEKIRVRQIFTKIKTVSDLLQEKEKNTRIFITLKGLSWNQKEGAVEFRNTDLKKFESELYKNSPDDASILF